MKIYIFIPCLILSFFACAQKQEFKSYTPAEFEKLMKANDAVQLVDVRRPDEYAAGHIKHAVLINVQEVDFIDRADSLLDKSKPVAVYCRSGKRSKEAAKKLAEKGFDVHELNSGYIGWQDYQKSKSEGNGS